MQNEVWMVIQKRRGGDLPDPVKMMYAQGQQGLHFTEEDAFAASEKNNEELGGEFSGVFRCLLEVVEVCKPKSSV